MRGLKLELLGIGIILLGLALSTNNIFGIFGGVLGFIIISVGFFYKDKKQEEK